LAPGEAVHIVTSEPIGTNALTVKYKKNNGALLEPLIYRTDDAFAPTIGTMPCYYCPKSIKLDKHPVIDDEIDSYSYVRTPCIKQSISHLSC